MYKGLIWACLGLCMLAAGCSKNRSMTQEEKELMAQASAQNHELMMTMMEHRKEQTTKEKKVNVHEQINYVEFPAKDMAATKAFFTKAFGWSFTEWGDAYMDVSDVGLNVGFYKADLTSKYEQGAALIVFYSENLEETQKKIESAGGTITRPIFPFPGGRRLHFTDPSGNEYGVWSDS